MAGEIRRNGIRAGVLAGALALSAVVAAGVQQATPPAAPPKPAAQPQVPLMTPEDRAAASTDYQRYCALCHGDDRQGHANDHAPSLRSRSLLQSEGAVAYFDAIRYGRPGTPMGGYLDEVGGPLDRDGLRRLVTWLSLESGVDEMEDPAPLPPLPAEGDLTHGGQLYAAQCASCHGDNGQGGTGTALRNPTMLALTPDEFLQAAIVRGRDGTPMEPFGDTLDGHDIASILGWLRAGVDTGPGAHPTTIALAEPPAVEDYVINPQGKAPEFTLTDGMFVDAAQLKRVLEQKPRMVLLDTRVMSSWQVGHIAGAVPVPYYSSRDEVIAGLPRDGTWIVGYCECPRAAAVSVIKRLREQGFKNTAVLYEGIGGWVLAGYPTVRGRVRATIPPKAP